MRKEREIEKKLKIERERECEKNKEKALIEKESKTWSPNANAVPVNSHRKTLLAAQKSLKLNQFSLELYQKLQNLIKTSDQ